MTNTVKDKAAAPATAQAWWRNGYCWLVISGPALVVVAGIITMVMAYGGADPVSDAYVKENLASRRQSAAAVSLLPAQVARNQAALGPSSTETSR